MIEAMKQALEALEQVTKELLAVRDELAERGARPTTNVFHQRLWDSSFSAYTDHAIPAAQSLRQAIREHAMYEVQRLGQEIEQEPVAWMKPDVLCDRACMYLCTKGFTQFPECANVPPQRTEQNFCPRCGKRTNDIHTCTPPQEKNDVAQETDS